MEDLDIVCGRGEGCQGCGGRGGLPERECSARPIIDGGFKESLGWEAI